MNYLWLLSLNLDLKADPNHSINLHLLSLFYFFVLIVFWGFMDRLDDEFWLRENSGKLADRVLKLILYINYFRFDEVV